MAAVALRSEERIGLGVAVVLHAALVVFLIWRPVSPPVNPPDRIEVTISDDVGLTSTSPEPQAQAAPDVAPEIGEPAPQAALPEPEPAPPLPRPEPPQPKPEPPATRPTPPKPAPRPVASPRPVARPTPRPVPKPAVRPEPPRPAARPAAKPSPPARPVARPSAAPARPAARPSVADAFKQTTRPGGSRVGDDFLKGVQGAQNNARSASPPAQLTGAQRSSLMAAIASALRPHWQGKVPTGADSEKLATLLRWNLNRDGSLSGPVEFVRQEGQTEANRAQWERHKELAIRAVQLAAPFDLPQQSYDAWKRVGPIRFDKSLSQ